MYKIARQIKRAQLLASKFYPVAKSLEGTGAKWRWIKQDARFVTLQLSNGTIAPEGVQQKLICLQHRILVASFNLMQELAGRGPLETEIKFLSENISETNTGFIMSEMEEMVSQLKNRHVWSLGECKSLCRVSHRLQSFVMHFGAMTNVSERNVCIDIQQNIMKLVIENLQQEDKC